MLDNRLNLGEEKIRKLFFTFVIPAVISMIASTTAGLIDSYFIGNFIGPEGIGAITLVVPISNMFFAISIMIILGGVVYAGIAAGKGNWETSNNLFNLTFFMILITSLILMIIVRVFGRSLVVDLMGIQGDAVKYILDYMMVSNMFLPFFMLSFLFNVFLKLDGFPLTIVWITTLGVFINIIMNYILIYVLSLGMSGAALATGISQMLPCIILLWIIIKKSNWKFKIPHFHFSDIKQILFNGSSEFLNSGSIGIAGYIYNLTITKFLGIDGIAAYGIAMQISGIAIMVFYGISDGVQSLVSFNYGAEKFDRVDEIRRLTFKYSGIFGCGFALILIFLGKNIAGIFVKNNFIKELSVEILMFYGIATIIAGININASTYYTALGQPVKSAIISLVRSFFGLVIGLLIFPPIFGNYGVWMPIIFTEILTIIIVIYYIKVAPYGEKLGKVQK